MEHEPIQPMRMQFAVSTILTMVLVGYANGVLCPTGCKCENEVLRTNCSGGGIEFVPIQLNPELHTLDLSNNKIVQLHYTFSFYEKLITLDVSNNRIQYLGGGNFKTQRMLQYLNLSGNFIDSLSKDTFDGLKTCTHLDLSNNRLDNIAANAFRELHSLTVLKLNNNQLDYFEEGMFKQTPNLHELYLEDNAFLEMPGALADLSRLKCLSLSRNLIEVLEDGKVPNLPELHTLLLVQNIIIDIQQAALSSLPKLDHLDLSDNNITSLPTMQLAKLSGLTNLKLSGNFLESLPPVAFRGLFHLKYLSLNRMEHLQYIDSRAFVDNINLEKVSLDYNIKVKKLPTRLFHGNQKVKYISVRYNSLETLEATHFPLDQLKELKVGGNPLNCNCSMGWLWNLLQENKATTSNYTKHKQPNNIKKKTDDLILDLEDIQCSEPQELNGKRLVDASKSQMDCSVGWIAIASVVATVIFIFVVMGGIVFWIPRKRSKAPHMKELSKIVSNGRGAPPPCLPPRKTTQYEIGQMERYIMPPPVMHSNGASMPLWDPYGQHSVNIYEQLNEPRDRPHIVYV